MNPQGQRNANDRDVKDANTDMEGLQMDQTAGRNLEDLDEGVPDNNELRNNEDLAYFGTVRQQVEGNKEIENKGVGKEDGINNPMIRREGDDIDPTCKTVEIDQSDVEATVSPEFDDSLQEKTKQDDHEMEPKLENTTQFSESLGLRKRRHMALEDFHAASAFVAHGLPEDIDNGIEAKRIESDTTNKDLIEDAVGREEAVEVNGRQSKQERNQCREQESRQDDGESSDCMEIDCSLLRKVKNVDDRKAEEKRQVARQSCQEMGYQDSDISWAEGKYQREHGGSGDYSATDLATYMEDRQDEVYDASIDPGLSNAPGPSQDTCPSLDTGPSQDSKNQPKKVKMTCEKEEYKLTAIITDFGHTNDRRFDHNFEIAVELNGCPCGNAVDMDGSPFLCNKRVIVKGANYP